MKQKFEKAHVALLRDKPQGKGRRFVLRKLGQGLPLQNYGALSFRLLSPYDHSCTVFQTIKVKVNNILTPLLSHLYRCPPKPSHHPPTSPKPHTNIHTSPIDLPNPPKPPIDQSIFRCPPNPPVYPQYPPFYASWLFTYLSK